MSASLVQHLALGSVGIGVLLLAALAARCVAGHNPIRRYGVMLAFLPAALLVVPLQLLAINYAPDWARTGWNGQIEDLAGPQWVIWLSAGERLPQQNHADIEPAAAPGDLARSTSDPLALSAPIVHRLIVAGYSTGFIMMLARRAVQRRRASHIVSRSRPVTNSQILEMWRTLSIQVRAGRAIRLMESAELSAPACSCWWRPVVLIPMQRDSDEDLSRLRFALLHELIHLKRGDPLAAALQATLLACFWFHPLAWLCNRTLNRDRELSCDALVVRRTRRPRSYALALLEYCRPGAIERLAAPLAGVTSFINLHRRLKMLHYASETGSTTRRWLTVAGAALGIAVAFTLHAALAAGSAAPTAANAERSTEESSPPAEQVVEVKVLDAASGVVKLAEIAALKEKRNPLRLIQMLEAMGQPVNGDSLTEQETVASASSASVKVNVLEAAEFNLNLPEGSELKAIIKGRRVTVDQDGDVVRITIEGGTVKIVDPEGVARVEAGAADGGAGAVLRLRAMIANDEVNLVASAEWADKRVPVRITIDVDTGRPAEEIQPPHGAVRWWLFGDGGEGNPAKLKIQWIYDVDQLRREAAEATEPQ
ncbi:MAG: M56 family metallopeptidase [Phycisphaerales bacterium]|nr:M56 family metallopeptidase [Phycisphaerales bacterium]